jgi:hypothetical protein
MSAVAPALDFGSVPNRFRDPRRPSPAAERIIKLVPGFHPDDALIAGYRRAHFQGDELADELVKWMHRGGLRQSKALFDRALEHGLVSVANPPAPLRAFFEHVEAVPVWVDRRAISRACGVAERVALGHNYVLYSVSLLAGYISAGITKTLVATGELEKMAARRIGETSKFLEDVYRSRTLERSSDGFKSTVRVRLMHAFVRHKLLRSGWETERWGLPINQADMAGTVLSFSITYLLGLRALGYVFSARERADVIHLWRYVGRLLGVDDALLAATERESLQLLWLAAASQEGPDEDGRALARALLRVPAAYRVDGVLGELLTRFDTGFGAGLTRWFVGDEAADGLGLPDDLWKYALYVIAPVNLCNEVLRLALPRAGHLTSRLGRVLNAFRRRTLLGDRPATFEPRTVAVAPGE